MLWIIAIPLLIFVGVVFIIKGLKRETEHERKIMIGFAFIFLGFAITRIFFLFSEFQIEGVFRNGIYYGDYDKTTLLYEVLTKYGYISGIVGISLFLLMFEMSIGNTRFFLTILTTALIIIIVIFPFNIVRTATYLMAGLSGFIVFIIIFMLSIRYRDKFEGALTLLMFGYLTLLIGILIDSSFAKKLELLPIITSPMIHIIGSMIAVIPFITKSRSSLRVIIYGIFFIIFVGIIMFLISYLTSGIAPAGKRLFIWDIWFFYRFIPWLIVVGVFILSGIKLLLHISKILKDFTMQRQFYLAMSISLLTLGISRFFLLFGEIEEINVGLTRLFYLFLNLGTLFTYLGISSIIVYSDKYFSISTKQLLSIVIIGFTVYMATLIFISPFYQEFFESISVVTLTGLVIGALFLIIVILKILVAIKIKKFRNFIWVGLGIFILLIGAIVEQIIFMLEFNNIPITLTIAPVLFLVGITLITINIDQGFQLFLEFYTNKQICLIHRGIIEGATHLCPKCFVKYCDNCFSSVISIEKKCWNCEYDFSQTVKTEEIEETKEPKEEKETLMDKVDIHKKPMK
jgi:hypothetical protein